MYVHTGIYETRLQSITTCFYEGFQPGPGRVLSGDMDHERVSRCGVLPQMIAGRDRLRQDLQEEAAGVRWSFLQVPAVMLPLCCNRHGAEGRAKQTCSSILYQSSSGSFCSILRASKARSALGRNLSVLARSGEPCGNSWPSFTQRNAVSHCALDLRSDSARWRMSRDRLAWDDGR